MAGGQDGPPVVVLPERVDRRLRLGPFPSARDALGFLVYAAVGSGIAVAASPPVGLGVVAAGLAVSIVRYDGEPFERRAVAVLRFYLRSAPRRVVGAVTGRLKSARRGLVPGTAGQYLSVIRAGGSPIAYLPPGEIARRFDQFREFLRGGTGDLYVIGSLAPMRSAPLVPTARDAAGPDAGARSGYEQLVRIVCNRRSVRRIDILLASTRAGAEGLTDLEARVASLLDHLTGLGVAARRLTGRTLIDAADRLTAEPAGRSS